MTREAYHALVEKLTAQAATDPAGYRRKVSLFANLGYAYLGLLLLLVAGLFWGGWWLFTHLRVTGGSIKLILLVVIFGGTIAWSILRGIFARIPPPDGLRISREEAPELYAEVDAIARELEVKPVSRIYLDNDFNAAAAQRPLFGMFGPVRNWLVLGVPLMDALTRDELRSVIAHEFGHFGGRHGSFSGKVYRQRQAWGRLLEAAAGGSAIDLLVTPFLKWYVPRLDAWSFVLVRAQEFEADAAGARAAGPEVAGRALVKASVFGRLCAEVGWKSIFARAATEPAPPNDVLDRMRSVLTAGPEPALGRRWLGAAMQAHTTMDDTHPCLRERLGALQVPHVAAEVPTAPSQPASGLLGAGAADLRTRVQAEWAQRLAPVWMMKHFELQQQREQLAVLETRLGALTPEEEMQRASLYLDLSQEDKARAILSELIAYPDLPVSVRCGANFVLGSLRLADEDESGVALLEAAMQADPACVSGALENLRAFYERNGRAAEARALYSRLDGEDRQLEAAGKERAALTNKDVHEPHQLSASEVADLVGQLAVESRIERAWLARKRVEHYATRPLYVLVVEADWKWNDSSDEMAQKIALNTRFSGETFVYVGKSEPKKLLQRIREDDSALIYARPAKG